MNSRLSNNEYLGQLAIVLHAHLPYVRKNEKNSLEEDWLFQAILECYIPLLQVMERSSEEVPNNTKITMSLSPTLLTLLSTKHLQNKFPGWINTRIQFLNELPDNEKIASHFLLKNIRNNLKYWENCSGNLVNKFRELSSAGYLDILTCAATHGYLPILRENPETVIGQIKTAIRSHKNLFGSNPLGIWLPECAYYEDLDVILSDCGIRYAVLDGHGILNSKPRPRYGVYAPICSNKGVAFFGRDSQSTLPVWSAREGFPGDSVYREFHKDLGWELSLENLKEKGILSRRPLGLKYHKITNLTASLGDKEFYDEDQANKKVEEHADKYLEQRAKQLKKLTISTSFNPLLVAPFDAELFGHWWYEGPKFIENIIKKGPKYSIRLTHLKNVLSQNPSVQMCNPSPSSWGQGGYHNYWLNEENAWIVPQITKAGAVFIEIVSRNNINHSAIKIIEQAGRELLLAESSDWSFILRAGTTSDLAKERIDRHLGRFWKLINNINVQDKHFINFLEQIEEEDKIFPDLRIEDWKKISN